jgi:PDZ domain/Aspartyl protease
MALPIGHLASRLGHDFDGIIGFEFIEQFVVEVDYQARVLRLHDKSNFVYTGSGESIPIRFMHGHPILEAEVTLGRTVLKGSFVLDIGSGLALALYSPFVNQHSLLNDTKTIPSLGGAGAGGETRGRIGRVNELRVGKFVIKSPVTFFSEDKQGAFASAALAGNIGARIANKFKLFLDYKRSRIILEPTSSFGDPFNQAFAGISVIAEGKDYRTFRIIEVLENSPASEAGLLKDDVIVAVDGEVTEKLSLTRVKDLLERAEERRLKIRRKDSLLDIKITPRLLI